MALYRGGGGGTAGPKEETILCDGMLCFCALVNTADVLMLGGQHLEVRGQRA